MSHDDSLGRGVKTRIHDVTGLQIQELIVKIDVLLKYLPTMPLEELICPSDYDPGERDGKHVLQEASILGHLRRIGALPPPPSSDPRPGADLRRGRKTRRVAIELGAGTGRLSDRLQRVTGAEWDHVLIDRRDFDENRCRDRIMRARAAVAVAADENNGGESPRTPPRIERVVADIGSLNLNDHCASGDGDATTATTNAPSHCVCVSKHLCGPACDLTIAALGRAAAAGGPRRRLLPPGAIATCCHYLCTWESFAGRDFWKALGLNGGDFAVAATASQWASLSGRGRDAGATATVTAGGGVTTGGGVVATGDVRDDNLEALPNLMERAGKAREALEAFDDETKNRRSFVPSDEFERNFSREEKVSLGMDLKRLLDLARAARMQELGYEVRLVRYTTRSIENRLLVMHVRSTV